MKTFASVAELTAQTLKAGEKVRLDRRTVGGDIFPSQIYEVRDSGSTTGSVALASGKVAYPFNNYDAVSFSIPTDFANLQAAIDTLYPLTRTKIVTINIEAGHTLTSGLRLANRNYSNFKITSTDATVGLNASFTPAIATDITGIGTNNGIFVFQDGCISPLIEVSVDANLKVGSGSGLICCNSSTAQISGSGKGVVNAEFYGFIAVNNSALEAEGCNFSASNWGCRVTTNSKADVRLGNLNGARSATYGGSGTTACLDVSRGSIVNFKGAGGTATGGAARGVAARRSVVSAEEVDVSNSGTDGIIFENGSSGSFASGIASNCGRDGVSCKGASNIDARDVVAQNSGRYGVLADDAGKVNARGVDVQGYTTKGILATNRGDVNAKDAEARADGATTNALDINVLAGGTLNAVDASGGLNQSANTVTANGIIFQ